MTSCVEISSSFCRMLGLDPKQVQELTIELLPGQYPVAHVTMFVMDDAGRPKIQGDDTIRKTVSYRIVEIIEDEPKAG